MCLLGLLLHNGCQKETAALSRCFAEHLRNVCASVGLNVSEPLCVIVPAALGLQSPCPVLKAADVAFSPRDVVSVSDGAA